MFCANERGSSAQLPIEPNRPVLSPFRGEVNIERVAETLGILLESFRSSGRVVLTSRPVRSRQQELQLDLDPFNSRQTRKSLGLGTAERTFKPRMSSSTSINWETAFQIRKHCCVMGPLLVTFFGTASTRDSSGPTTVIHCLGHIG